MAIDAKLTTEEVIKELAQIAGRPTEDEDDKDKVADEDDGECVRKKWAVGYQFWEIMAFQGPGEFSHERTQESTNLAYGAHRDWANNQGVCIGLP